jgi:hypothetical protein
MAQRLRRAFHELFVALHFSGNRIVQPSIQAKCQAMRRSIALLAFSGVGVMLASGPARVGSQAVAQTEASQAGMRRLETDHLPNVVVIHPQVFSGGSPAGQAAFAELRALGVKTIVSVDGAKPDAAAAAAVGLRYVHLPHGYDGIPAARAQQLAQAVRSLPGPIYIHCHHGKHRSPAAAAVACVGAGLIEPQDASRILEIAGTSRQYRGLFLAAEQASRFPATSLEVQEDTFVSHVPLPALAEAMVQMEQTLDHLQQFGEHGWQRLEKRPDLEPAHEALLLREHYTELARLDEVKARPAPFQALVATGESLTKNLERDLESWVAQGRPPEARRGFHRAVTEIANNCKACHQSFRDVPLTE